MVKVSDLFDVRDGHSLELNRLEQCAASDGIPFVSRKSGDNGIAAYVKEIPDVRPATARQLTCALRADAKITTLAESFINH